MKNMKKLVSLLLAVCLMASLAIGASAAEPTTVDVSGGTGTSSVSLSSTSDGTLDGDPAATKMNVTIPTILPSQSVRTARSRRPPTSASPIIPLAQLRSTMSRSKPVPAGS